MYIKKEKSLEHGLRRQPGWSYWEENRPTTNPHFFITRLKNNALIRSDTEENGPRLDITNSFRHFLHTACSSWELGNSFPASSDGCSLLQKSMKIILASSSAIWLDWNYHFYKLIFFIVFTGIELRVGNPKHRKSLGSSRTSRMLRWEHKCVSHTHSLTSHLMDRHSYMGMKVRFPQIPESGTKLYKYSFIAYFIPEENMLP